MLELTCRSKVESEDDLARDLVVLGDNLPYGLLPISTGFRLGLRA